MDKDFAAINKDSEDKVFHWQHKIKCGNCGLHFIALSDFEHWPQRGTTRGQNLDEPLGVVFCPECGSTEPKLHAVEKVEGYIFQHVFGTATLLHRMT